MTEPHIYLTANANSREPEALAGIDYVHVKCKTDGSQTLIVANQSIDDDAVVQMTPETAQALLDDWIDEENAAAVEDANGNLPMQSRIDLGAYLNRGN